MRHWLPLIDLLFDAALAVPHHRQVPRPELEPGHHKLHGVQDALADAAGSGPNCRLALSNTARPGEVDDMPLAAFLAAGRLSALDYPSWLVNVLGDSEVTRRFSPSEQHRALDDALRLGESGYGNVVVPAPLWRGWWQSICPVLAAGWLGDVMEFAHERLRGARTAEDLITAWALARWDLLNRLHAAKDSVAVALGELGDRDLETIAMLWTELLIDVMARTRAEVLDLVALVRRGDADLGEFAWSLSACRYPMPIRKALFGAMASGEALDKLLRTKPTVVDPGRLPEPAQLRAVTDAMLATMGVAPRPVNGLDPLTIPGADPTWVVDTGVSRGHVARPASTSGRGVRPIRELYASLKASLGSRVDGFPDAVERLAFAAALSLAGREDGSRVTLIQAPSGAGKTHLLAALADAVEDVMGVQPPFAHIEASQIRATGWKGLNVPEIAGLVEAQVTASNRHLPPIVLLDEIDKLAAPETAGDPQWLQSQRGAQHALLGLLGGNTPVTVSGESAASRDTPIRSVSTGQWLVCLAGVFDGLRVERGHISDAALMEYGFVPELVSRIRSRIALPPRELSLIARILRQSADVESAEAVALELGRPLHLVPETVHMVAASVAQADGLTLRRGIALISEAVGAAVRRALAEEPSDQPIVVGPDDVVGAVLASRRSVS